MNKVIQKQAGGEFYEKVYFLFVSERGTVGYKMYSCIGFCLFAAVGYIQYNLSYTRSGKQ